MAFIANKYIVTKIKDINKIVQTLQEKVRKDVLL